jgi:serine/threonine protein kinase
MSLREWNRLATVSFESKLKIAIDLTLALQELGQQRIIHKDINPANILIHPILPTPSSPGTII